MVKYSKKIDFEIPFSVSRVTDTLKKAGFEAYLIGGCVRNILLEKKPKDWDVTTNATPEKIQSLFPKTVYENEYGTVGVINEEEEDMSLRLVEVTPYRLEAKYSNKRHPDAVSFTRNLEEDLKRRDFTINAMALDVSLEANSLVDLFGGEEDLAKKKIKAVGKAEERFDEDALRILRGIRLATELGFTIEPETKKAMAERAEHLKHISQERIRDEFTRIIMSSKPSVGLEIMREIGILPYVTREIEEAVGVLQNKAHIYPVWEHLLKALDYAASKDWELHVRLSALFHDVGKPATRRWMEEKKDWTFYGHDVIGAKMSERILERLKYPKRTTELVRKLVRYHMFFSDTELITLSAVRRIVRNVGSEHIWDLMKVRFADRIGMGKPKESPYRLRKYEAMIEQAMRDPITVGMLKINGGRVIELLHVNPGPKIGQLLHVLLEEVLEDSAKNTEEYLENRTKELNQLSEIELKELGLKAKGVKEKLEEEEIGKIHKKWWVT